MFDIVLALLLLPLLGPVMAVVALVIAIGDGRPVFYRSTRMRSMDRSFSMWKFRTMQVSPHPCGVPGGSTLQRVTRTGRWLRACRLDELPQLWNVLYGEMSFVGPRPPLRQHVAAFPRLYGKVLQSQPGVTGLASVIFHAREEALLRNCRSMPEAEEVYQYHCIPRKAQIDLIYLNRRSIRLDLWIIWLTFRVVFRTGWIKKGRTSAPRPYLPRIMLGKSTVAG